MPRNDESFCYDDETTSISVSEGVQAKLYPNPNNGNFTLAYDLNKTESNVKLMITDISGRLVYEKILDELNTLAVINLNDVQTGIYFAQLVSNNGKLMWTKKIAISK